MPDAVALSLNGMRAMVARYDWSVTPLGAAAGWPTCLKMIVQMMLDSAQEMVIWWGPDARQIYNDAYALRIEMAGRLSGLGEPAAVHWANSWKDIGPQFDLILAGGPSIQFEDVRVTVSRNTKAEETYWSYSLTPLRDDAGKIAGALVIFNETTLRVLAARRQATINFLRQKFVEVTSLAALEEGLDEAVDRNPGDLLFAHIVTATPFLGLVEGDQSNDLCISAGEVGVDVDLAVIFTLSSSLILDGPYRIFLEQLTLLIASARHRIDDEVRHSIAEQERDRLLLDAPVGAAVMIGSDLVYRLVNAIYANVSGRAEKAMVGKSFIDVFPELIGAPVHEKLMEVYRSGEPFISLPAYSGERDRSFR